MVRNYSSTFGGERHCGSGDMVLVVIEGQDFSCPCLDWSLVFIFKAHSMPCSHTKFQDVDTIIYRCIQGRTFKLGHAFLQE